MASFIDNQFKPGDTVILKSGGPLMTVVKTVGHDTYTVWFKDDGHLEEGRFFQHCLTAATL